MKLRSLLMGSAVVALLGIGIIGCNENPVDDPPAVGAPAKPTSLGASSKSETSVILNWTASADTGTITYTVSWSSPGTGGSGSTPGISATTALVSNLANGQIYKFNVVAVRGGVSSAADTLTWMGAQRFETTDLKMYEFASALGSAIALDTVAPFSGPRNVSVASEPTNAQLAMVVSLDGDSVYVGPAFAFDEFSQVNLFDPNTYIGQSSYVATSMDTWYTSRSLDNFIATVNQGNVSAFGFQGAVTGNNGQGFYVRTGTVGLYHYARVFVKNVGGKILQGTAPNRFIEVSISYQGKLNHAYAKTGKDSPVGSMSQKRRN